MSIIAMQHEQILKILIYIKTSRAIIKALNFNKQKSHVHDIECYRCAWMWSIFWGLRFAYILLLVCCLSLFRHYRVQNVHGTCNKAISMINLSYSRHPWLLQNTHTLNLIMSCQCTVYVWCHERTQTHTWSLARSRLSLYWCNRM